MALRDPENAHWRDSARRPRFFIMDAYATFPMLLFLLNIAWWTFYLAVGATLFFLILEKFGFTIPVFFRYMRSFIAGNRRIARPVKSSYDK